MDSACLDLMKSSLESEKTGEQGSEAIFLSHSSAAITDDRDSSFQHGAGIWMNKAQQVTLSEAVDQLTRLMAQNPTEDNPGTEDNSSTEDHPGTEDNLSTQDNPDTEDNPNSATQVKCHLEEQSNTENSPNLEDNPNTDDSPNAKDTPITVDTPNKEDNPNTENIPKIKDKPNTVDNPSKGNNQNTEDNPNTEINPSTQETLLAVEKGDTRVIWLLVDTQWEKLGDVPVECARFGVCICGVSDGIIVLGGWQFEEGVKSCCYHFSVATKQWKRLMDAPMAVKYASAVEFDDMRVLVVGGQNAAGIALDTCMVLDVRRNTWSQVASLPSPVSDSSIAAVAEKVFILRQIS